MPSKRTSSRRFLRKGVDMGGTDAICKEQFTGDGIGVRRVSPRCRVGGKALVILGAFSALLLAACPCSEFELNAKYSISVVRVFLSIEQANMLLVAERATSDGENDFSSTTKIYDEYEQEILDMREDARRSCGDPDKLDVSAKFTYMAQVDYHDTYSLEEEDFSNVYVVQMYWFFNTSCGPMCGGGVTEHRIVVLTTGGHVLRIDHSKGLIFV